MEAALEVVERRQPNSVVRPHALGDHPLVRAGLAAVPLVVLLVVIVELVDGSGNASLQSTLLTGLGNLIAVTGLAIFVGNSGFLSFGHAAFVGLGAYVGSVLIIPPQVKSIALPHLPGFIAHAHTSTIPALGIAALVCGAVALVVGFPITRLDGAGVAIATIALLITAYVVFNAADTLTRGSETLYGVPPSVSADGALGVAVVGIVIALVFKQSRVGLRLQASREDEDASTAAGVGPENHRLVAWVLSAMVAGAGGVVLATTLGAFAPSDFYLDRTFLLLAMLIVGGMTSVSGAVLGAVLVSAVAEILRRSESGIHVGPLHTGTVFGLTDLGLSLAILATMYFRREGLLGYHELTDLIGAAFRRLRRRRR